jgi:hypothetical protein
MRREDLIEYAKGIAARSTAMLGGLRDRKDQLEREMADIDQQIGAAEGVGPRLSGYRTVMKTASPEDPICPRCWMEHDQKSVMSPVASHDDDDQFRCKACKLE